MKLIKNDIIKNHRKHLLFTLLLISILFGCSSPYPGSKSFLDKPFDPFLGSKKVKGNEEQFYSPKLDSLLKTSNGIYLQPDIQGVVFQDYSVTAISLVKKKQVLLLFYDRNSILRDTLMYQFNQTYSLNTELKLGKKGVCIGSYFEKENYFKIETVYEISKKIKLKKETSNNQVVKCLLPQEYSGVGNSEVFSTFKFGTDFFKSTPQITLRNGRWCERCEFSGSLFRIFYEELSIEISSSDYLTINTQLTPGSNPRELLINYKGISSFKRVATPEGQEAFVNENISLDRTIGKLRIINEKQVELIWFGLYDMVMDKVIFKDDLPFEKNKKGRFILNYCFSD